LEERLQSGRSDQKSATVVSALQHDIVFGRHIIRAALDELDRVGLVQRRQNRGVVVSDYAPQEVDELYEIRFLLQQAAARRIKLPAAPDFIEELSKTNDRYVHFGKLGDLNAASIANDAFHRMIFGACRNAELADLIQQYWVKTAAIHCYAIANPALAEQSRQEHSDMIEAMRIGDRARFEALCVEHMQPALAAFKAAHGGWT
jgi:DNA-binding GntR family transcriptional regulator